MSPADKRSATTSAVSLALGDVAGQAVEAHAPELAREHFAQRLAGRDADLWGEAAVEEASKRLGWVDLPTTSRELVGDILDLKEELAGEGIHRVVLCGMGGSSLAPEVITATDDVPLVVLDGTDPGQVERAMSTELQRTVVVVSSKSGSTVETDSQRRAFEKAFTDAGIDAASRIVVVIDPGSPLEKEATSAGYRMVFTADPQVGGRYSALTAFGLVPSGLAGADIRGLLEQAADVAPSLAVDGPDNPALRLGSALGGTDPLRDKIVIVDDGSGLVGFGDWAEQLLAESTGKEGTGLLPVVVRSDDAPELQGGPADDVLVVRLVGSAGTADPGPAEVAVSGSLGGQMQLWETVTAVAGRLLGINPFDQPDVESAKKAARGLLDQQPKPSAPDFTDGGIEVRATDGLLEGADTLESALQALLDRIDPQRGYLAVMAYLDREADSELADIRQPLARRSGRPVTFGWGPRFLHSTGQYHKGGPPTGVYLQVTADASSDVDVPDRPFTFGRLIAAQAAGDAQVLAEHGRPVLRLHLPDRVAGIQRLLSVARGK
ncbi:MAG: glucose-6-phosphate isomerase [Actinomycetes bacterium]